MSTAVGPFGDDPPTEEEKNNESADEEWVRKILNEISISHGKPAPCPCCGYCPHCGRSRGINPTPSWWPGVRSYDPRITC